jgi:hypothetical protein
MKNVDLLNLLTQHPGDANVTIRVIQDEEGAVGPATVLVNGQDAGLIEIEVEGD